MKLDSFDALALAAASMLLVGAAAVALTGGDTHATGAVSERLRAVSATPPEAYLKLAQAKLLLESGQPEEAVVTLSAFAKEYPAEPDAHALMGQAYDRMLDYPSAMREFRIALTMAPDYVDKKSPKFIGKRVKASVKEGMAEAKAALAANPSDQKARAELKDAYYIERMLAGGCE